MSNPVLALVNDEVCAGDYKYKNTKISDVCYDQYSNILERLKRSRTDLFYGNNAYYKHIHAAALELLSLVENNMVDWSDGYYTVVRRIIQGQTERLKTFSSLEDVQEYIDYSDFGVNCEEVYIENQEGERVYV